MKRIIVLFLVLACSFTAKADEAEESCAKAKARGTKCLLVMLGDEIDGTSKMPVLEVLHGAAVAQISNIIKLRWTFIDKIHHSAREI